MLFGFVERRLVEPNGPIESIDAPSSRLSAFGGLYAVDQFGQRREDKIGMKTIE